jgi:Bifunctional DNA primase/polymerase, N-terminal/AAA domain
MKDFLEIALSHAALGLYVFPVAKDKSTRTAHGFKDASIDPEQIRAWWTKLPSANPGFAPGASGIAVVDIDHGLADVASFIAWRDRNGIPATYTVRSGSRPEFKVHLYFKGAMPDVGMWELDGCSGQVKSLGGYVLAAGSEALHGEKHDKPGAPYEVIDGLLGVFAPTPDVVRQLRKPAPAPSNNSQVPKTAWSLPVHAGENRTGFLLEQTGAMRNLGCGKDAIFARMIELNDDPEIIADPVDGERLESTAANCARFPVPEAEPKILIGQASEKKVVTDWRERYHTFDEMDKAPKPTFLIDGFLQKDVIAAIAAPVGQRKTLIAANVTHALLTGAPLFDHFTVTQQPTRVLYLCPEMGLLSFTDRLRKLGLLLYVGKTLFCRTMNSEGKLALAELTSEELDGAVLIVDTAVRFIQGDENSSEDMRVLAEDCFRLMKAGAASVLVLFHSPKGTKDVSELTLENAMRGSGELGAFVSSCWATRLQNPDEPYQSASYLKNVKQRDFESKPFEIMSGPDCRLHIVEEPNKTVVLSRHSPNKNRDGNDAAADDAIRANLGLSLRKLRDRLAEYKITRTLDWIGKRRNAIRKEAYDAMQPNGGKQSV